VVRRCLEFQATRENHTDAEIEGHHGHSRHSSIFQAVFGFWFLFSICDIIAATTELNGSSDVNAKLHSAVRDNSAVVRTELQQ